MRTRQQVARSLVLLARRPGACPDAVLLMRAYTRWRCHMRCCRCMHQRAPLRRAHRHVVACDDVVDVRRDARVRADAVLLHEPDQLSLAQVVRRLLVMGANDINCEVVGEMSQRGAGAASTQQQMAAGEGAATPHGGCHA